MCQDANVKRLCLHLVTSQLAWAYHAESFSDSWCGRAKNLKEDSVHFLNTLKASWEKHGLSLGNFDHLEISEGPGSLSRIRLSQALMAAFKIVNPKLVCRTWGVFDMWKKAILVERVAQKPWGMGIDRYNGTMHVQIYKENALVADTICQRANILSFLKSKDVCSFFMEDHAFLRDAAAFSLLSNKDIFCADEKSLAKPLIIQDISFHILGQHANWHSGNILLQAFF